MLTAVRALILFPLSASGGVLLKSKQSFFRRISPIFLAAVVLVTSLCVVPVSAVSDSFSDYYPFMDPDEVSETFSLFLAVESSYLTEYPYGVQRIINSCTPAMQAMYESEFGLSSASDWFLCEPDTVYFVSLTGDDHFDLLCNYGDFSYYEGAPNFTISYLPKEMTELLECPDEVLDLAYDYFSSEGFPGPYASTAFDPNLRFPFEVVICDDQNLFLVGEEFAFCCVSSLGCEFSSLTVSKLVESPDAAAHEKTNSLLAVISSIGEWIVSSFLSLVALFWVPDSGMTFSGVLAVSGLAFALIFLLIRWILSLFHR